VEHHLVLGKSLITWHVCKHYTTVPRKNCNYMSLCSKDINYQRVSTFFGPLCICIFGLALCCVGGTYFDICLYNLAYSSNYCNTLGHRLTTSFRSDW
jgi:hypothetical protein